MRTIMVMNAKGGCGKSTLAANIATWYANEELDVALADFDPQGSSVDWLAVRPAERAPIQGLAAWREGLRHLNRGADVLVIDAPARVHGGEINELLRRAQTVVVPVLPSPLDMRAVAHFIAELQHTGCVQRREVRIGLVANRVKRHTNIAEELDDYLRRVRIPYVASLRETQNYNRAASRGLGIFELPPYLAWQDWEQWEPLMSWLNSKRSRPEV